jgi:hypothetical protein
MSHGMSTAVSTPAAPLLSSLHGAQLIIGIMTFQSPIALGRRHSIRRMMRLADSIAVRFVLSNSTLADEDSRYPDVLRLGVRESGRVLGTYLLNNAFFRFTLGLDPRVPYLARADDDAFFDPPTILAEMRALEPGVDAIYGPFHEFYMWSPASMTASCFDYSGTRFMEAVAAARVPRANKSLPRFQRECLHEDLVGPYPFAKGPFVAYTRSVLERLFAMDMLSSDEAHALGARRHTAMRNVVSGRVLPISSRAHPRNAVVFDDIYYGYLVLRAFAGRPLKLVFARLSEYRKEIHGRFHVNEWRARIYHKLKTSERFGYASLAAPRPNRVTHGPDYRAALDEWKKMSTASGPPRLTDALHAHVRTEFQCVGEWASLRWLRVRNLRGSPTGHPESTGDAAAHRPTAGTQPQESARSTTINSFGATPTVLHLRELTRCCKKWVLCDGVEEIRNAPDGIPVTRTK